MKQAKRITAEDLHVGRRIRARRAELGMSQTALGDALGLTFQQVQKYERGVNRVGAGRLSLIARHLNVDVPYFYEGLAKTVRDPEAGQAESEFAGSSQGRSIIQAWPKLTGRQRAAVVTVVLQMVA